MDMYTTRITTIWEHVDFDVHINVSCTQRFTVEEACVLMVPRFCDTCESSFMNSKQVAAQLSLSISTGVGCDRDVSVG